jgi:hypothetical protein
MPTRKNSKNSTHRRHKRADRILAEGFFTMRPCSSYMNLGVLYILSSVDERCEQCYRNQRKYELASPWEEFDRFAKQKEKVREQRLEAEMKAVRLRK